MKFRIFIAFVIVICFLTGEFYMRIKGTHATYSEIIGKGYATYYSTILPTWYHTWTPGDSFLLDHSDFKYSYATNSLGLREKNIEKYKPDSILRIITIGDSYTEGVGAPYDSTWPRLLEKQLNSDYYAQVINAGESGSDPFYDYTFYRDKLREYKPDIIITSLNSSDFTDYILRGGLERFHKDGSTHYRKAPWYEALYHYSHLFRAILQRVCKFPFKGIFVDTEELYKLTDESVQQYVALMDSFNRAALSDSAELIFLVYPIPSEIVYDNELNQHAKDAMSRICAESSRRGISTINLWENLRKELRDRNEMEFTYKNDKHFNAFGYSVMAQLVFKEMEKQQLIR